ncbi:MAG: hypothetical protein AAGA48_31790 [Myxococcota bacterium]
MSSRRFDGPRNVLCVLHEVEQVLQREQQEGNSDRLIPILLDDDLFETGAVPPDWWPAERNHVYRGLQGRVCARFTEARYDVEKWNEELGKLLKALRKQPKTSSGAC